MRGAKILITGPTGQVASPIAQALAADNEVWGIARFTNAAARVDLEKAGIRCENGQPGRRRVRWPAFRFRLRAQLGGRQERRLGQRPRGQRRVRRAANGALPQRKSVFLHCSSAAVYDPPDDEPRKRAGPRLGDNHKPLFPEPIPFPRSPAKSSPGRWHAPSTCPPSSPGSTSRTATTGDGRSITWR